jgi:hypothetical protein
MDADLLVSRGMTAEASSDVEQAFAAAGLRPTLRRVPAHRGAEQLSWLVIAALPLTSFLTTLGAKLAEDAYKELRLLGHRVLRHAPDRTARSLVLEDDDSGTRVVLDGDLPDEGYRALLALDVAGRRGAVLVYDRGAGQWVARGR